MRTSIKQESISNTRFAEKRYQWRKPSDLPDRLELIDAMTGQPAAIILTIGRRFVWSRFTNTLIHGIRSGEGECDSLSAAQQHASEGMTA
ncbi:hypothetical protein NA78x_003476 [Anatilimnocola sp. NA78]|uniref:hypothetical protein n=1 Tax=Anatilimnocola sp. NA78 TaxID=3415683 RepID=UPI003CE5BE26